MLILAQSHSKTPKSIQKNNKNSQQIYNYAHHINTKSDLLYKKIILRKLYYETIISNFLLQDSSLVQDKRTVLSEHKLSKFKEKNYTH